MLKFINKGLISFQTDCVKAPMLWSTVKYESLELSVDVECETLARPTSL